MGFEDRDYYRDGSGRPDNFFGRAGQWLLRGRVSLFRVFGIHVQAHSSLIVVMMLMLLFGGPGFHWQDRVISSVLLFVIVLLHEFGHCFGARWSGGDADEIVMHPLGGLALTQPLPTWRAHLITSAAGPLVNVVFCIGCGIALYTMTGQLPWKPFVIPPAFQYRGWLEPTWLLFWLYQTNQTLLLFNLMPIYPLDGGRITQELLWPRVGYYKSMLLACNVGQVAAVLAGMMAFATGQLGLLILAMLGFFSCMQMKRMLQEAGPWGFSEYDDPVVQSLHSTQNESRRVRERSAKLMRRQAEAAREAHERAAADEAEIDRILAKVSASGMHSLTRKEQKTLKEATARQQQRETARRR